MNKGVEYEVRQAGIDDLASIFHLGEKVFTSHGYSNLYRTWDEYEVTTFFNQESENVLVAEDDGKVVGFAMGTTIEKARSAWSYGHLVWLGVEPDYARSGLGSMLFDRFKRLMKKQGVRMLMVDTQADNEPAISFFRKKGFENPTRHVYLTMQL
ncbi:GNAT family N-acetyltransferase [Sediminispirochaeta smaragdinae]|uniref:GCN5-related N-acetyltransferase n=1 Tax=Sediminispirochaeta smaragdinae (strain DSM 11293 / JCM 15392 / SEBR 4228) TaxID=573413 RepID=E1R2P1_SEDSS|nr:GNAT family N-acetyltransferase [Sediminispirochaeta smaragdinae]ADK80323.1 GCN5-related N-acetyltransferase [Sediminispirochaeta smaragdinae DSM 11293]